jgi:putative tryptophan/tyrosine transport system permease protein
MSIVNAYVNLVPVTLMQSVIYAFAALGIMIPFRLLSFPDLTVEGSFPFGGCVAAALLAAGVNPLAATLIAILAGGVAGLTTAAIHLALRLNTLLCGILVLTMLFSINIRVMGRPNIPLFQYTTLFESVLGAMTSSLGARIALVALILAGVVIGLWWFFSTEAGMALRAVGASQSMARAQGISVTHYTLLGLGLSGALCAGAGALLAQNQAFADVGMGFGVLVNGLASVIVGEQLVGRQTLARQLLAPVVGAVLYYQIVSLALALGMQPSDLKLLTGLFVLLMLGMSYLAGNRAILGNR